MLDDRRKAVHASATWFGAAAGPRGSEASADAIGRSGTRPVAKSAATASEAKANRADASRSIRARRFTLSPARRSQALAGSGALESGGIVTAREAAGDAVRR